MTANAIGPKDQVGRTLCPMLVLCQVMGTVFRQKTLERHWKLALLYRAIVFTILILCLLNEVPTIIYWTSNVEGIHGMLAFIETRLRWLAVLINFLLDSYRNKAINEVVLSLSNTSLVLKSSDVKSIFRFQFFVLVTSGALLIGFMCIGLDVLWRNPYYKWYTSTIYIVTEFYTGFTNLQFVILLFLLKKYFKTLRENLNNSDFKSAPTKRNDILVFFVANNYRRDEIGEIVKFRQIHMILMDACLKTNHCYSLQVLLFLTVSLVEMTYSFRSAIVFYINPESNDVNLWRTKYWFELSLIIFWGGYYFWQIVIIVSACETVILETNDLATVINELINKVDDCEVKKQVFSLQMMNHKVVLTAGKFVVLNFPLINSIIGTLITYLVIITTFN